MANRNLEHVENVFHAALDLPPEERGAYLEQACAGNDSLYAEIYSLVSASDASDSFIEEPALNFGLSVLSESESMTGKVIGSYKVLSRLGKGGMGEVYLAEDTKLDRKVALKFLSQELVNDNWAKRQLIKEAQAVAQLDHPNICSVYGIEQQEKYHFIVMQYVEGQTLSQLIRSKALEQFDLVNLAQQIVGAIAEAHAHGIIHRDIKPGNIMVTTTGQVKVLDFGLAKIVQQKQNFESGKDSISNLSQIGLLQGTVAYMSPEQLRGEKLDYRTDVFSIGTVLYEMITGKNPYGKGSTAETISSILTVQPPTFQNSMPEALRALDAVVTKCAQKEVDQRYQSATALLYDLNNLQTPVKNSTFWRASSHTRVIALLILLLLLGISAAFIYNRIFTTYSLAVLPIVNETGPANDYFSQGLTVAITDRLSGLSKLRVKPRTTVSGYKADNTNLQSLAVALGVDALLIGRLTEEQGALTLEMTLVDSATGNRRQIWKNNLTLSSAFAIPEEVSRQVTANLELWLGKTDKQNLATTGTENGEAFRQYMLGRYYWRNRNKENIEKAIKHFYDAIQLDPLYAEAYAGLADCYVLRNTVAFGDMSTKDAMSRAYSAANEALRLKELPEAHTVLGLIYLKYEWKWLEAEREIKRALELDPDYAPAHYAYSILLTVLNRQNEALAQSKITRELDPFSLSSKTNYCRSFYYARDFDSSVSCFQEILKEDPDNSLAWYVFGFVALQRGRSDEAISIFEKLYEKDPALGAAAVGYAYGKSGRTADALKVLASAKERRQQNEQYPSQEIAIIYLGLGDKNNALSWLEKAYDERFASLIYLTVEPIFADLHGEPRFDDLAQRLNLKPAIVNTVSR